MTRLLRFSICFAFAAVAVRAEVTPPDGGWSLEKDIRPLLQEFCVDCHNPKKLKGEFDMEPMMKKFSAAEHHDEWEKVVELITSREMPPDKQPQPTEEQRQIITQYVENELTKAELAAEANPGKVTIRRLNKEEYRRTIRELLRVDFNLEDFPTDEVGYGYNNIGDVLSLSPMLLEKYLAAAEQIAKKAIVAEPAKVPKRKLRGDKFDSPNEWIRPLENRVLGLYREGEATADAEFIRKGDYLLKIRAYGELAGPEAPKLQVKLGGKELGVFEVNTTKPKTFEIRTSAEAGRQPLAVGFLNNFNGENNPDPKLRGDRNLFVESVEIEGPFDGKPEPTVAKVEPWKWKLPEGAKQVDGKLLIFATSGDGSAEVNFPAKDEYVIRVRANADQAGSEPAKLRIKLGDRELGVFDIHAKRDGEDVREARVTIDTAGKQQIGVGFVNDFQDPATNADRNLAVLGVEIVGPINSAAANLPEPHRVLITKMPAPSEELAVARELLKPFARRAYRRPATDRDVDQLAHFVELSLKNGGSFLEGMQAAVQAALCSPKFLFRWELDSDAVKAGEIRELNDHEVASRLSYFLWSSMPDNELFALADKGELLKNGNLEKQVQRMLKDWRVFALVENFGGQWLQVHNINEVDPDPKTFPNFSWELREDFKRETYGFIEAIVKEDRSVLELIDADFTVLNERLAKHYGIPDVKGGEFRKVSLPPDSPRGGVLGQGSVLLATSMPTRTSPVIRGKWILEQLLGTPPPPAPANVPPLEEVKGVDLTAPLRKRLEQHRDSPDCAGCHAKMDPLGFALENFDALGAWRTMDGKNPIDASAKLPNGTEFNGPAELKKVLKNEKFVRTVAENMMTYGLGRGLERYDKRAVEQAVAKSKEQEFRFSSLVIGIVTSDPFLKRKVEPKLANH